MCNRFDYLLAKSYPDTDNGTPPPAYARLLAHLRAVECAGEIIIEVAGDLVLRQLALPVEPWKSRLYRAVKIGCVSHDLGKANDGFQKLVRGLIRPTEQPVRHELLTALLLVFD